MLSVIIYINCIFLLFCRNYIEQDTVASLAGRSRPPVATRSKHHAPSMTTIRYWFNEFKPGRTSVFDEERPGRPIEVTTQDMVKKMHDIVLADRCWHCRHLNCMHSKYPIRKIGHEKAIGEMEQKRNRMTTSEHCLDMFKRIPKEFLRRFVAVNATWIHHYTSEMKEQWNQWTSASKRAPKKTKTVPSAGKVMSTIFGGSHGIIFTDYL